MKKTIKISKEVKEALDKLKHHGQTYDGILRELMEKLGYSVKINGN